MKRSILERYRRDENGQLVIDIAATKVSNLYDDFDKHAPFIKKELDYDLVEYLIDSVREVAREPFSIQFVFAGGPGRKSIRNYFEYLLLTNRREQHKLMRSSAILLSLGG